MTVQYYTKNVYGKKTIYLVNSEAARDVLALIAQRTISESQLARFERLGVTFERVFEPET